MYVFTVLFLHAKFYSILPLLLIITLCTRKLIRFQAVFCNNRTTDNMIIIWTPVDLPKHLRAKREWVYWYFVDLQKVSDPVNREALWCNMRKKGLIADIKVYEKYVRGQRVLCNTWKDRVTRPVPQETRAGQGCSLSPHLFVFYTWQRRLR